MSSIDFSARTPRAARLAVAGAFALLASGCATTGATFRSGVGDTFLSAPPYYAGATVSRDGARIGHLPVAYQRGASHAAMFDPSDTTTALAALLGEMTAYLDSLGMTTRLEARALAGTPPDVHFGCQTAVSDDCERSDDEGASGRGRTMTMRLAVGRPSAEWIGSAQQAMQGAGVGRVLVLTLEVGQYWVTQTGLRGDKSIRLGTGHSAALPWLTSTDAPVSVVQLTGALVGPDGLAIRIGAEGLLAKRTRFLLSALGAQQLASDEDIARLRTLRRDDLPGQPLAWKVAVREMVEGLLGG